MLTGPKPAEPLLSQSAWGHPDLEWLGLWLFIGPGSVDEAKNSKTPCVALPDIELAPVYDWSIVKGRSVTVCRTSEIHPRHEYELARHLILDYGAEFIRVVGCGDFAGYKRGVERYGSKQP